MLEHFVIPEHSKIIALKYFKIGQGDWLGLTNGVVVDS